MIITNKIEIGFRIPDDSIRLQQFEAQNDISNWVRRETTEYVTYSYVTVQLLKGYENEIHIDADPDGLWQES